MADFLIPSVAAAKQHLNMADHVLVGPCDSGGGLPDPHGPTSLHVSAQDREEGHQSCEQLS